MKQNNTHTHRERERERFGKRKISWEKIVLTGFGFYIAYLLYASSPLGFITASVFVVVYQTILWAK